MTRYQWPLAIFAAFLLILTGCSESTAPGSGSGDGLGDFQGQVDPSGQSFTLKSLEVPSADGVPVRVELIGRFVRVPDLEGQISMAVAVRNADRRNLYAPAEIALSNFEPGNVYPVNQDWTICPDCPECRFAPSACLSGYVYSHLLGDDGQLSPGETSAEKIWTFQNSDMVPFSFHARARFGMEPAGPGIGGVIFNDLNANGERENNENPFVGSSVHVSGEGIERSVQVGLDGRYLVQVPGPGLYRVEAFPPPTLFAPIKFTTPNPLEVAILPDGQSFLDADFGINTGNVSPCTPVLFADESDSLSYDGYDLVRFELDGHLLRLSVAFSGCSPDHPLQLYMVGGVMESMPPQVRIKLSHDNRGELCEAYFRRDLCYDLTPILETAGYPTVIVRYVLPNGQEERFELNQ